MRDPLTWERLVSVEIRAAKSVDVEAIRGLVQRAYGPYVSRIGREPRPMEEDYGVKVAEGLVTVAEDCGEVVGLIVLVTEPDCLLVENVAVEPGRQSEGIGRALLAYAEGVARDAGLSALRLYTHVAMTENRAFYPRLGYEETDGGAEEDSERAFFRKRL